MAERICVNSDRIDDYSAQFIIACDALDFGCNGGHLDTTMQFLKEGLPVSDRYQSDSECDRIPIQAKCGKIVHSEGAQIIKSEIKSGGPVTANMIVFKDLLDYESGVYEADQESEIVGAHAVLIEGWGVTNGTEYWIVKNSWGSDWGDAGYFKIKIGDSYMAKMGAYSCEATLSPTLFMQ